MSDLTGQPLTLDPLAGDAEAEAEAEAIAESLAADGVELCKNCGVRPVRPRKSPNGRVPTTCAVCAAGKGRAPKPPGERKPPSVKISFGAGARSSKAPSSDVALVQEKAKSLAVILATGLTLVGQAKDGEIVAEGADTFGKAWGQLAPYEPWLVDLCKGGEISGRAMAWTGAAIATLSLILPILINHKLIPEGPLVAMFGSVSSLAAEQMAAAPEAA